MTIKSEGCNFLFLKPSLKIVIIYQGDSGGPLTVDVDGQHVLVGDTSYGHQAGCAQVRSTCHTHNTLSSFFRRVSMGCMQRLLCSGSGWMPPWNLMGLLRCALLE